MYKLILNLILKIIKNRTIFRFQQFIKFCIVGTIGAIIDIGGLYLLVEFLNIHYLLAATVSFILAVINNYFLNKYWTFKNSEKKHAKQFTSFVLVSIAGLLINLSIMYIMVDILSSWYIFAKIIASIIVLFWNFLMNKHITFKSNKSKFISI
ncbi:GtrA family protein [Patescibacteria group bacterium]